MHLVVPIKTTIISLVLSGVLVAASSAATGGRLPGAKTFHACGGAGPYWPTMTLALEDGAAWVACKEEARVVRLNTKTGRIDASIRLDAPVLAVTVGLGSVWAVDTTSTLYRIRSSTAKVTRRDAVGATAAYNVWTGGGSVWVADDQGAAVIRVSAATGKVVKRISVGDGPADMVFSATSCWVINHRDRRLFKINLANNAVTGAWTMPGDAPERIARLAGSLWITGRGTDLLRVDPESGEVKATIEIGAGGIDVVAAGDALWLPVRSAVVDSTGLPTMQALRRVSATTGKVTTPATASGRIDVHGLQARGGFVWIADNRSGVLYRVGAG